MNTQRRLMIKGSMVTAALGTAIAAGLISPRQVLAANLPAFAATSESDAFKQLFAGTPVEDNAGVVLSVPDIAENGAVVPITIESNLKGIKSLSLFVSKNATPLVAYFKLPGDGEKYVSTRIKMGQTSNVIAIAEVGGKLLRAQAEVKVTLGGCGG